MTTAMCVTGDSARPRTAAVLPVVLVLDHLRSAHNVGNVFRIAEAVRARELVTCGYTATPPHGKLAKTARGCDELVPCRHVPRPEEALQGLKDDGYRVYGVETTVNAVEYWATELCFPAAFVLGNEALGISEPALRMCDAFICLPACGRKNSINVGNCAAVCMYEALRQWRRREAGQ